MMDKMANVRKAFGPTFKGHYPGEMRTQLWPLCCGARIISGFKSAAYTDPEELKKQIEDALEATPDFQVFAGEVMRPALTFLTLNHNQMKSQKIMKIIRELGFVQFAVAQPRGHDQGFFVRDTTESFKFVG